MQNLKSTSICFILIMALTCLMCRQQREQVSESGNLAQLLDNLKSVAYDREAVQELAGDGFWQEYENNPVVTLGKNTWDGGALGSMTVLKVGDIYHMYYEAWGVRSEKEWDALEYTSLQIGHAVSLDGLHWVKDPANPVLTKGSENDWDKDGTWDPFVIYEDGLYKMWYGGGGGPSPCDWGYAVSEDGSNFVKKGQLSYLKHVEDDHIVHDMANQKYYMYYWNREYEPMGLFRAESPNETDFDFANASPIKIENETYPGMYKFTHVLVKNSTWFMLYGNFVRPHCADGTVRVATSSDGINWTSRNKNMLAGHDAEILKVEEDLYIMYYGPQGYFDRKDCDIRLAIYSGELNDLY
jgi:hypothetical protein